MMAMRHEPSEHSLAALLYDKPKRPKLSRETAFAIAAALAVHGAFGVYVYLQKFEPTLFAPPHEAPVIIDIWTDKPPPPPPPERQVVIQPNAIAPRPTGVSSDPIVDPLPLTPVVADPPVGPPAVFADATPTVVEAVAPPTPPAPAPRVFRNADWLTKPSAAQMDRLYPRQAAVMGVSGGATLLCDVAASGSVGNCAVTDESPKGRGFGAAALAASKLFRMNPKTVDGKPIEGAKVRIPIIFNLAD